MPIKKISRTDESAGKAAELFDRASSRWAEGRYRLAFQDFRRAAEMGDLGAQNNLAFFYENGIGARKSPVSAIEWYRRAARRGSRTAAANLAMIYEGMGKVRVARFWYSRAVFLGDAESNIALARIRLRASDHNGAREHLRAALKARSRDITADGRAEAKRMLASLSKPSRGEVRRS